MSGVRSLQIVALQTGNYLQGPYAAASPSANGLTPSSDGERPVVDELLAGEKVSWRWECGFNIDIPPLVKLVFSSGYHI